VPADTFLYDINGGDGIETITLSICRENCPHPSTSKIYRYKYPLLNRPDLIIKEEALKTA
jgi:hypothetical protein